MLRATLKGLLGHKLRLIITALAVTLGVAFVSGTFVLTDTINNTFDKLFGEVMAGTDVIVRSTTLFTNQGGGPGSSGPYGDRDPMPESVLDTVRRVKGVASAEPNVQSYAQMLDKHGKTIGGGGPPTFGVAWSDNLALSPLRLRSGRAPHDRHEVVIDAVTARDSKVKVGDRMKILFQGPAEEFTVVGVAGFGSADNLGGATLAAFELPTAQRVLGRVGRVDTVNAVAEKGVSRAALKDRIGKAIDPRYEALTGTKVADETAKDIKSNLSFIRVALLTFAFIALFVATFIIFNTFSIIVAQRAREMALLRALGASRRQVTASVVGEAFVVGVLASAVGLALGLLVAVGLLGMLRAGGFDLPATATQFQLRTAIVAMLLGTGVTTVAALGPARRAGRQSPVAVLREAALAPTSWGRRVVGGVAVTALGVGAVLTGLIGGGSNAAALTGLGIALTFIGVTVLSPLVARPIARVIGSPLPRLFGVAGKLARDNSMRTPRRTASTAAALMVGLGLVAGVTVLASSVKASADQQIDRTLAADYAFTAKDFNVFSTDLGERLKKTPGVAAATSIRGGEWRYRDGHKFLMAADPEQVDRLIRIGVEKGDARSLGRGDVLVWEKEAKRKNLHVGSTLPMTFARSGTKQVRVGGIYKRNDLANYFVSDAFYRENFASVLDFAVFVKTKPGVSPSAFRASVADLLRTYPNVRAEDRAGFKKSQHAMVNQLLLLINALLALAVIIAISGIVNTLVLSIFERTRELGLLRAVGMSRRQVRRMVRWESVIIAVFGAVLGLVLGVIFGTLLVNALHDQGINALRIPFLSLAGFMVFAVLAGVLAAALPARRAARLDVLSAIAHD
jgi:putative ABC transport system permease protein